MRRVLVSNHSYEFEGTIADNADTGDRFTLTEDDGNQIVINGWLFHVCDCGSEN